MGCTAAYPTTLALFSAVHSRRAFGTLRTLLLCVCGPVLGNAKTAVAEWHGTQRHLAVRSCDVGERRRVCALDKRNFSRVRVLWWGLMDGGFRVSGMGVETLASIATPIAALH